MATATAKVMAARSRRRELGSCARPERPHVKSGLVALTLSSSHCTLLALAVSAGGALAQSNGAGCVGTVSIGSGGIGTGGIGSGGLGGLGSAGSGDNSFDTASTLAREAGDSRFSDSTGAGRAFYMTPMLSVCATLTDNVNLSATDKQSDLILAASPGI